MGTMRLIDCIRWSRYGMAIAIVLNKVVVCLETIWILIGGVNTQNSLPQAKLSEFTSFTQIKSGNPKTIGELIG